MLTTAFEAPRPKDSHALANVIDEMVERVACYLDSTIQEQRRFPARSYYGESFASLLLAYSGDRFAHSVDVLKQRYREMDKEAPQFHWEFNKYAWVNYYRLTGDSAAKALVFPLRFKNTAVTNWTLLRSCTRYLAGVDVELAVREAMAVTLRYQTASGLICDQPSVRSFQYHCFSAVMLAEIYELSGDRFFLDRCLRAVKYIEKFMLRSGDTLYIGRGQEQSFGYGTLVYLFTLAFKYLQEPQYLGAITRCLSFLRRQQRRDGSFPLVLNGVEDGFPVGPDSANPKFPGWYQYNNYFDYLPFLAVFLKKAAAQLASLPPAAESEWSSIRHYKDEHSIIVRTETYEAVVSKPSTGWNGGKGYWTNDLPFPYIERDGTRITPCYGGEQFGNTMYAPEGLPYPLIRRRGVLFSMRRGRVWARLFGSSLVVFSLTGLLIRKFKFRTDSVVVEDYMFGWVPMFAYYLFENIQPLDNRTFKCRGGIIVTSHKPLVTGTLPVQYFCGGVLQPLVARAPGWFNRLTIWLEGAK